MNITETRTIEFHANEYEYDSGIDVQIDEEYVFKACVIDKLMDWFVPTTLDGFFNPLLLILKKRVKSENCFKLIAMIKNNGYKKYIAVGSDCRVKSCPISGRLYFFVNDADSKSAYKNNKGSIEIQITRVE
jgi:hypothetical protein